MAGPRYLDPERLPLKDLCFELLYTALRLRNTPAAKALVAVSDKLLEDARKLLTYEAQLDEAVIEAEVAVDWRRSDLNAGVTLFAGILAVKPLGKSGQPLFERFFAGKAPHEVRYLALRPALRIVQPWVASLKAESEPDLASQGRALEKLVDAGQGAVAAQDLALQGKRDFVAGPRRQLFEEANATRQGLHGELHKLGNAREWVASFFRVPRRITKRPPLTLAAAQAEVAQAQNALTEAQAQLEAVRSRDAAAAAQAAEREKKQQALSAAKQQNAELKRRIAELEDELED